MSVERGVIVGLVERVEKGSRDEEKGSSIIGDNTGQT